MVKLSDTLEQLKTKRNELEAAREATIRQMQQIHAQITVRRTEGETCLFFATFRRMFSACLDRDQWKQKYLIEKKKTVALEERARTSSVGLDRLAGARFSFPSQIDRTDVKSKLEQAKLDLKSSIKVSSRISTSAATKNSSLFSFAIKLKTNARF